MLTTDVFWEKDVQGALMLRNNGFITRDNATDRVNSAKQWLVNLEKTFGKLDISPTIISKVEDEQSQRIFELDAVRTFDSQQARALHVSTLCTIYQFTEDYHQGLGFIVAWLLLFFSSQEVVAIVRVLHEGPMNGYFKGQATNFYRDANVIEYLLHEHVPSVANHLEESGVVAGTYASKWLVGLNLHILPFKQLFAFYEKFLSAPNPTAYSLGFAISVCANIETHIVGNSDIAKVLEYLRFDVVVMPNDSRIENGEAGSFFDKVITDAGKWGDKITASHIESLRDTSRAKLEEARKRVEAMNAENESSDGITFSDESDD